MGHLIHHKKELMHNKKAVKKAAKKAKKKAKKKLSKEEIAGMKKVKKAIDVWGQQKNIDARIAAAERDDKAKARKKEARKIKDKAAMKAGIKKLAAKAKAKSAAKKAAKKTKKLMKKAAKGKKKKKKKKFVQKAKVIGGNIIKGKKLQTLAAAHLVVTTHNTPMHAVP